MLRTNLSTRPFYNERVVHLVLGLVALIVLILTVLNVITVVQLSRQNTTLASRIRDDRTAADEFARRARQIRSGIDKKELSLVVTAASEANMLIDSRTFSWTEFFNQIEATLPPDVMLASVRPTVNEKGTEISMIVRAKRGPDVDEFMEKLEATGAFENILPLQQGAKEDGTVEAALTAKYVPNADDVAPPAPPATTPEKAPAKPKVTETPAGKRGTP
jgi:Fimbrial assembly protein (PilN)